MFDKEKFGIIIKKINDTYPTQYDFADKSNVNRTYLSQYINLKLDEPPKPKILKKIADASKGITTYKELMQICGYTDLTDFFFEESIKQNGNSIPIICNIYFENDSPVVDFYGTNKEQYITANFIMDKNKEYFAYKINDDSMLPLVGIGDLAIIEKTDSFSNGETCLLAVDNQIIIRKIIDFKDYIELHTAIPYSQPLKLTNDDKQKRNFKILGKVVRVENSSAFK